MRPYLVGLCGAIIFAAQTAHGTSRDLVLGHWSCDYAGSSESGIHEFIAYDDGTGYNSSTTLVHSGAGEMELSTTNRFTWEISDEQFLFDTFDLALSKLVLNGNDHTHSSIGKRYEQLFSGAQTSFVRNIRTLNGETFIFFDPQSDMVVTCERRPNS